MALDILYPFATPEDICNRAMDHIGTRHITSLSDPTPEASRCAGVYDRVRMAELRRNLWTFATRRAPLRASSSNDTLVYSNANFVPPSLPATGTMLLTPAVWSATIPYTPGAIVADPTVPGLYWTSTAFENLNNAPGVGAGSVWDIYYGPLTVAPFDPTQSYWASELVYIQDPNTRAIRVFRSLVNANGASSNVTITQTAPTSGVVQTTTTNSYTVTGAGNPWVMSEWNDAVSYNRDQVVVYESTIYRSATEQNHGNVPALLSPSWISCGPVTAPTVALASSITWLPIQATVSSFIMEYPIGSGPLSDGSSRNAYRLPNGFLRVAPQNPKQGQFSGLGAPSRAPLNDWTFEGNYLISQASDVLLFRFVANITNVTKMDPMFCEGLGARIAMEVAEPLTQNPEKFKQAEIAYAQSMVDARQVNAIEAGQIELPEDDFITARA